MKTFYGLLTLFSVYLWLHLKWVSLLCPLFLSSALPHMWHMQIYLPNSLEFQRINRILQHLRAMSASGRSRHWTKRAPHPPVIRRTSTIPLYLSEHEDSLFCLLLKIMGAQINYFNQSIKLRAMCTPRDRQVYQMSVSWRISARQARISNLAKPILTC